MYPFDSPVIWNGIIIIWLHCNGIHCFQRCVVYSLHNSFNFKPTNAPVSAAEIGCMFVIGPSVKHTSRYWKKPLNCPPKAYLKCDIYTFCSKTAQCGLKVFRDVMSYVNNDSINNLVPAANHFSYRCLCSCQDWRDLIIFDLDQATRKRVINIDDVYDPTFLEI